MTNKVETTITYALPEGATPEVRDEVRAIMARHLTPMDKEVREYLALNVARLLPPERRCLSCPD